MPRAYHKANFFTELLVPGMPEQNLYCFCGMFFGWTIEEGLIDTAFFEEAESVVSRFRLRQLTGPSAFRDADRVLADDMFTETGNRFARDYFDTKVGVYASDFQQTSFPDVMPEFEGNALNVLDTWANYDAIRGTLDRRFLEWRNGALPRRS